VEEFVQRQVDSAGEIDAPQTAHTEIQAGGVERRNKTGQHATEFDKHAKELSHMRKWSARG
jgi:hypothetical protein